MKRRAVEVKRGQIWINKANDANHLVVIAVDKRSVVCSDNVPRLGSRSMMPIGYFRKHYRLASTTIEIQLLC